MYGPVRVKSNKMHSIYTQSIYMFLCLHQSIKNRIMIEATAEKRTCNNKYSVHKQLSFFTVGNISAISTCQHLPDLLCETWNPEYRCICRGKFSVLSRLVARRTRGGRPVERRQIAPVLEGTRGSLRQQRKTPESGEDWISVLIGAMFVLI